MSLITIINFSSNLNKWQSTLYTRIYFNDYTMERCCHGRVSHLRSNFQAVRCPVIECSVVFQLTWADFSREMDRPDREVCRACSTKGNEPVNSCQIVSSYSGKRFMFFAIVIIKNHSCFPTSLVNFDRLFSITFHLDQKQSFSFRFQVYENCLQDISTVDVSKGHRVVALKSICEQIIYCCDHTALINNIPLKRLFVLYPFSGGFGNLSRKFINYKF